MSIRVLKLKSNNRAVHNRVNNKKMLGLSYVKKGCCRPMSGAANKVGNIPIRSLSYHNYLKTAHSFKKFANNPANQKCCNSNGKLVKRVEQTTYKRAPETASSLHTENKKNCVLARNPRCSIPTDLICLKDRDIQRGKIACGGASSNRNGTNASQNKKVRTFRFVSAGELIHSKKAERKKANGDKYDSDLMDNNPC